MNTNKRKAIVGAKVVLETGIIWDGVILLENEKIRKAATANSVQIPEDAEIIDAKDAYIGPGFVDDMFQVQQVMMAGEFCRNKSCVMST